ncbi:MAG: aldehyde dehydrogenase family protein [Alphaproteobacteria bacterium]|nr:aldehyde dehydrogenase family protein [Alphaproteobacteria bacterium]MBU2367133.1 aldehyde dehydrogenase family protein [Alphaproteobacteria bacterium]
MSLLNTRLPSTPTKLQNLAGGVWFSPVAELVRNSPAHGIPVSVVPLATAEDVDRAVAAARARFDGGGWSDKPAVFRSDILLRAAELILERVEELSLAETLETGKPLWQARNEIVGAADIWRFAAGQARVLHGQTFNNLGSKSLGLVLRDPIGVVGLITPWNFPFFILAERLPFILAAGCTVVVKPSELTSTTTVMMGRLLEEAGVPAGVVNIVTGLGQPAGSRLVEHPDVDMVSFTGSTRVGRSTIIASAGNIKKLSLELGGKNPVIVMADADLEKAADGIVFGILHNAGQCCVSGSRLIVSREVEAPLTQRIVELMQNVKVGDPLLDETRVGPIVNEVQFKRIKDLVDRGVAAGAKLLTGGQQVEPLAGHFLAPTFLAGVKDDMPLATEEIFGPVLAVSSFDTKEEALQQANCTRYGLSATIWTTSLQDGLDLVRGVRAGRVWLNTTITGGPEMPIGGYGESGLGRETGLSGIEEYTEVKSIIADLGERTPWAV